MLSKFGNLSIREIVVVTSAYGRLYRLWGRGRGVPRQPDGGGECHLFLTGNRAVVLGNQCFSWREIASLRSRQKTGKGKGSKNAREKWGTGG